MTVLLKKSGTCFICQQTISSRTSERHLQICLDKQTAIHTKNNKKAEAICLIKLLVGKLFWLQVGMRTASALSCLDNFLREIWLECCGHLSQFIIQGHHYSGPALQKPVSHLLTVSTKFCYEYDFGDTTEIEGLVWGSRKDYLDKPVKLLARNNPPNFECATCTSSPEVICSLCGDFCCAKCCLKHPCEEDEMLLPVVNSPRMGVCGYTGEGGFEL